MYFEPAAVPSEAKVALPRFLAIVGRDAWRKRESTLQQNLQANPFLHPYYKETFALEFEILGLRAHLNATARLPNNIHEYYRALVFIVTVDRIYRRLTESGRKGLKGRMLDGLRSQTYGLMPLASEIDVATHLMLRGFDVSFSDLERGGGFDLLAIRDSREIEVDVKLIAGDIGRKIHRRRLYELSYNLYPLAQSILDTSSISHFVRILLPDRLGGDQSTFSSIRQTVANCLKTGCTHLDDKACSVYYETFEFANSPMAGFAHRPITQNHMRQWLEEELNLINPNVLILDSPSKNAFIIAVETRRPDRVLAGLMRQLKDSAARQFTGQRPGVLFARLADLSENELFDLVQSESRDPAKATSLQIAVTQFFSSHRRSNILSLVFTVPGRMLSRAYRTKEYKRLETQESGPAYHFTNNQHPLASDPGYSLFDR